MKTFLVKIGDSAYEVESTNLAEAAKKAIVVHTEGRRDTSLRLEITVSTQPKVRKVG